MAAILKTTVSALVLLALLGGCNRGNSGRTLDKEVAKTGTNAHKAQLLETIEKKFESPEAHYELGKLYSDDRLWDKAQWHFNVAIGFDPVHHRAQAALVKLLSISEQTERSKLAAEMYMNQASVSAKSSYLLGQAFQKELFDEYALSCYQQALALAPDSAALHKQIGLYYLSKGQPVRAEEYFKRSFQIDPYQADVAGQLGRMGIEVAIPRKGKTQSGEKIDKLAEQK